jgi:dipeptidyl aminopeptidase/acylaminoacyl peptidase
MPPPSPGDLPSGALTFLPERPEWDVQIQRLVAETAFGGADVWECQRVAERIRERGLSADAWTTSWLEQAQALVDDANGRGTPITRRERLLRAFNYFRTAEFFLPHSGPERLPTYTRAREAFRAALPLLPIDAEPVDVPDGDVTYEGYVFSPPGAADGPPRPGVLCLGGADSYAEELYFFGARALVDRGAVVMTVDTPGRGVALRRDGLHACAAYEEPTSRALDVLAARPEVDADRIGVVGSSLGGYYAPRLAAADERVKALVCWCACFDVLEDLYEFYPPIRPQMQWVVGAADDAEARARLADFHLRDAAPRITCPIFISHGRDDEFMPTSSAERLFHTVASTDKQLKIWERDEGGALHCGYDNWAAYIPLMFDWLLSRLQKGTAA